MSTYILRKGVSSLSDLSDGGMAGLNALKGVAGKIFYVDAGHSSSADTNEGTDPQRPLKTIAAAYALCTSDVGDVIYVTGERRYREAELVVEKDGIRIIGGGWGTEWNQNASATAYVVKLCAKNVIIANIQISVNDQGGGIYVGDNGANKNAFGCKIENCFIRGDWYTAGGTGASVKEGIFTYGATMLQVRNNLIWGWTTGVWMQDGADRTTYGAVISDNHITYCKTYGIHWQGLGYTSGITGNYIWDQKTSVNMTAGINLAPSTGGILVAGNFIGANTPVADNGDLNFWVGNYVRSTEAASETLSVAMAANDGTVT